MSAVVVEAAGLFPAFAACCKLSKVSPEEESYHANPSSHMSLPWFLLLSVTACAQTSSPQEKSVASDMCGDEKRDEVGFWHKLPAKDQNNCWYTRNDSDTVIVFVHGLFSDSRSCWYYIDNDHKENDRYWPEIVSNDYHLNKPSIFLGGYSTDVDSGPYGTAQAAKEVLQALSNKQVLTKPNIIFICHSAGGVVARYLLANYTQVFVEKHIGLALYASPSRGSYLAQWSSWLVQLYGNKLVSELAPNSSFLSALDKDFKKVLSGQNPRITGIEAVENHFVVHYRWWPRDPLPLVVDAKSAGAYFGEPTFLSDTDHYSAVKPKGPDSPAERVFVFFAYQFTNDLMEERTGAEKRFQALRNSSPTCIRWSGKPGEETCQACDLQVYQSGVAEGDFKPVYCSHMPFDRPVDISMDTAVVANKRVNGYQCARCDSSAADGSAALPPSGDCPGSSATRHIPNSL